MSLRVKTVDGSTDPLTRDVEPHDLRILVIGPARSGKTAAAIQLGEKLSLLGCDVVVETDVKPREAFDRLSTKIGKHALGQKRVLVQEKQTPRASRTKPV